MRMASTHLRSLPYRQRFGFNLRQRELLKIKDAIQTLVRNRRHRGSSKTVLPEKSLGAQIRHQALSFQRAR